VWQATAVTLRRRVRHGARAVVTDVRPLQVSADYRRLWFGMTAAQLGQQMTTVAIAIQVYDITRSSFAVGLVGLCSLVPLVLFGLYGGAVADAMDRRRLALIASAGLWALSLSLVAQAALGLERVGLLYVVVAAQAGCFAVNNPARAAIIPRLLPRELLPAANALSMGSFNLGLGGTRPRCREAVTPRGCAAPHRSRPAASPGRAAQRGRTASCRS
jgi:MFS family permease